MFFFVSYCFPFGVYHFSLGASVSDGLINESDVNREGKIRRNS